jgi:ubiquinone/menaquinone biosynthesis C-methylase UbiE
LKNWLTSENLNNFSGQTHWEYAAQTRMGTYLTQIEMQFVSKSTDLSNGNLNVLDVGAEAGRFSLFAANKANVFSIDIDAYALRRLKLKNKEVNIIRADARNLPLKNEAFDIVLMIEVLDYIPELELSLLDSKRILKPNASCIISFGNKASLKAKLKAVHGKSYRHSYREFMRCLAKVGFIVKNKLGYSWLPLGRTSQSPLVSFFAVIEKIFLLQKVVRFSPWIIMSLTKPSLSSGEVCEGFWKAINKSPMCKILQLQNRKSREMAKSGGLNQR